ncbi:FHA domain-containing protein [Chthonomonas calidirosea]|uniref:FHA domain-containing protein n=1 Tax=Chthonomonas calidirosea TaxID=454171 RepID=UPI0006DD3E6C|nr:FHA domain-containing protein [Chthonomonas calidirosea]CEK18894.1 FHA domain-containing protein [Chthonomonas calidirosea]
MRSRIIVCTLAGLVGGLVGALLQEALIHYQVIRGISGDCLPVPPTPGQVRLLAFCVGGLPGMLLGTADGVVEGNSRKLLRGIVVGLIGGFLLGYIGMMFGNMLYNLLGGTADASSRLGLGSFLHEVIARAFGWSLLGAGIGTGAAISTLHPKRIGRGALGGFLGGFIGGFVFDLVAVTAAPLQAPLKSGACYEAGGLSRIIGFTAIATCTGLLVGIVEELLKEAWVRVLVGRNEGRDFSLERPVNILGRDERCDVPLYGDPSVGIQHAAICKEDNRHVLVDAGTPTGTVVNGQPVPPNGKVVLRDGDMIQIGMHRILFRERATASKVRPIGVETPRSAAGNPLSPMPSHLCPYCGAPKDAAGNCRCTVTPSAPMPVTDPLGGMAYGSSLGASAPTAGVGTILGRLVGIEGPIAGQIIPLEKPNITIGREVGRDIVIANDPTVSRTHAELSYVNGVWMVRDNNSSNGTFVNGMRISIQELHPGDIVQFGSSRFRFE